MYFTYLLKSLNFTKTYIGITENLERRLKQHNLGYHFYTKRYKPWKIIYSERFENRLQAREKEKYFKSCAGRKWIKNNIFSKLSSNQPGC